MKKSNISAIVPVHEYNDEVKKYLEICLSSINEQVEYNFDEIIVVSTKEIYKKVSNDFPNVINLINRTESTSYQSQVMVGVNSVTSKYFTIIEFDDEISSKYLKNMILYSNSMNDVDIFLSTIIETNLDNKKVKDTNIQAWSRQLVGDNNEHGFLNVDLLMNYTDFKVSGALIKKDVFNELNGFKNNIIFSFGFEFLLRALKNNIKIFVIPKLLYKHLTDRNGSITEHFLNKFTKKDVKFWFDTAISESDFSKDREIDITKLNEDVKLTIKK